MLSFASRCLAVVSVLSLGSIQSWAQATPAGGAGRATPYVINLSQGTAALQPQNPYSGSVPAGKATPNVLPLSLKEAIDRGLKQNLGLLLTGEGIPSARGQYWKDLSELLPNVTTSTSFTAEQINLRTVGLNVQGLQRARGQHSIL